MSISGRTMQNFYTSIKPLIIFSRTIGILPYSYNGSEIRISRYYYIYAIVLCLTYFLLLSSVFYVQNQIYRDIMTTTTATIQLIQSILAIVYVMVTFVYSVIARQSFEKLSTTMLAAESAFEEITEFPCELLRKALVKHVVFRVAFMTIGIAVQYYSMSQVVHVTMSYMILPYFFPVVLNFTIGLVTLMHVIAIKRKFRVLNECLLHMVTNNETKEYKLEEISKNRLWKVGVAELGIICSLHHSLTKVIKAFNEAFGTIMVVKFGVSFVTILTATYICFLELNDGDLDHFAAAFAVLCMYAGNAITLCVTCSSTTKEVNKYR